MYSFERIYYAAISNEISLAFSLVVLCVFILSVVSLLPVIGRPFGPFSRYGSGLMTTIGVLGTFTGIFIGLLDFDVSNIDSSVPLLLEGLKIAFVTSIVGMAGAIVFRLLQTIAPKPAHGPSNVSAEDLYSALQQLDKSVNAASDLHNEALIQVKNAIAGDGDGSIVTQIQKLRTSFQDGQNQLVSEFREFARNMAENNSKALIEALEQVIRDFNTKLTEQFGENFKQLNQAVGSLLQWQENYRDHIENLEKRLELALSALESTRDAISVIAENTGEIPRTLEPLQPLLKELQAATKILNAQLEAIAGLRDKAVEAFPIIEKNIDTVTEKLAENINKNIAQMSSAMDEHGQSLNHLHQSYDDLKEKSNDLQKSFMDSHSTALENLQDTANNAFKNYASMIEATSDEIQSQIQKAWSDTQDGIGTQFETLDENLQKELQRALEILGSKLASLSEKFVDDYRPLTESLREVVQLARRTN